MSKIFLIRIKIVPLLKRIGVQYHFHDHNYEWPRYDWHILMKDTLLARQGNVLLFLMSILLSHDLILLSILFLSFHNLNCITMLVFILNFNRVEIMAFYQEFSIKKRIF